MSERTFEIQPMSTPEVTQLRPQTMKFQGIETSIPFQQLPEAMAKFQETVKHPKKDKDNPFFKSKYVPLENVVDAIQKAAHKIGLSYFQWAVQNEEGQVGIGTRINHGAEFIIFDPIFYTPGKGTVQDSGSVQTYLRRYALIAAFGIASEDDDDGNTGSDKGINNEKSPAQVQYEQNQAAKTQPSYEKGSYKNNKQNQQNAPKSSQNGAKTTPQQSGNTTAAKTPEKATEGQITKIKAICESIANTQNIHPDDVYLKFQTIYKEQAKSNIPDMDKLSKGWAGGVISGLTKHNEAGQLTKVIPKEEPKKEEPKKDESK